MSLTVIIYNGQGVRRVHICFRISKELERVTCIYDAKMHETWILCILSNDIRHLPFPLFSFINKEKGGKGSLLIKFVILIKRKKILCHFKAFGSVSQFNVAFLS